MNTLTVANVRALLDNIEKIKNLTMAMRKEVRIPTWAEVANADYAADLIRDALLRASLTDVAIDTNSGSAAEGTTLHDRRPSDNDIDAPAVADSDRAL